MSSDTENFIADSPPNGIGDWICAEADCKNLNFARRTICNRCNKEKTVEAVSKKKLGTEIGKVAAEKSRGLFSAEDWQCSKCANVNWARRQTCNLCNCKKFTDVEEERTGYGGGYNDRGVVEYKDREDSDSEFDEFGRKKKPKDEFKFKTESPVRSSAGKSMLIVEEDDDDDDDDGDEGDLSKYALFDSDDDIKKCGDNKSSNSSNSSSDSCKPKSRSRSRSAQKENIICDKRPSTRHSSRSSGSSSRNKSSRRRSKSPRDCRRKSFSRSRSRSTGHGKYKDNHRR